MTANNLILSVSVIILSFQHFDLGSATDSNKGKIGEDVTVELPLGKVVGTKYLPVIVDEYADKVKEVVQFLGIPFAEPPVGKLRFQKPQPVKKWDKPLEAKKFKDACMQNLTLYGTPMMLPVDISEDCLYINIWTPAVPKDPESETLKPVLLFFHGGGLVMGTAAQADYAGHVFAGSQDVVVATINYRLGTFGFLSSPDGKRAPGNAGVWDAVEALKFLNQNVKKFGGDPKKVTIGGISAGAYFVSLIGHSHKVDDLFDKMVLMSASAYIESSSTGSNSDKTKFLAESLGCPKDDDDKMMECLEGAKADDLVIKDIELIKKFPYREMIGVGQLMFDPVIDDDLIKKQIKSIANDEMKEGSPKKKVLSGTVNWEGGILKVLQGTSDFVEKIFKNPSFEEGVKEWLKEDFKMSQDDAQKTFDEYKKDNNSDNEMMVYTMVGDARLGCPNIYASKDASKVHEVYRYVFGYKTENNDLINMACPNMKSVCHGVDITYTLGTALMKFNDNPQFDEQDWEQSWSAMGAMGKFVRGEQLKIKRKAGEVDWPLYKESNEWQSVELNVHNDHPSITDYRGHYCQLFKPYIGL